MERLGVYKQWKHKRLVKELEKRIFVEGAEDDLPRYKSKIEGYLSGKLNLCDFDIYLTGLYHLRHAAHKSLTEGKPDLDRLSLAVMYWLRSQQFYLAVQDRYFAEQQNDSIAFRKSTEALAMILSLGWVTPSLEFGKHIIKAIKSGYYTDSDPDFRNRANWFYIKLFADWQGMETKFEPERYPAPLYDELLRQWREPNSNQLNDLLLAVCDQHTHECFERSNSITKQKDFGHDSFFGWPVEVLMVFRLREDIGLENPELDHPLMQTGLAPYLVEVPVVTDELLDRVTEKACQEYPELQYKIHNMPG
ncbi:hypothetical protein [Endozoicomonas numazuensis]|uniref:PoNi C-terminal domain-containing protein n=1 Tax=Endozoicomonas numazuensis TaxID=1137799 RepID=A0A081N1A0_9GAMM|nr:hypothetical protein [Endozoicomonas numazuensis]KEQ12223.1 hypothetical protein GZ78_27715 [Endozoicomonas numazuensis]